MRGIAIWKTKKNTVIWLFLKILVIAYFRLFCTRLNMSDHTQIKRYDELVSPIYGWLHVKLNTVSPLFLEILHLEEYCNVDRREFFGNNSTKITFLHIFWETLAIFGPFNPIVSLLKIIYPFHHVKIRKISRAVFEKNYQQEKRQEDKTDRWGNCRWKHGIYQCIYLLHVAICCLNIIWNICNIIFWNYNFRWWIIVWSWEKKISCKKDFSFSS